MSFKTSNEISGEPKSLPSCIAPFQKSVIPEKLHYHRHPRRVQSCIWMRISKSQILISVQISLQPRRDCMREHRRNLSPHANGSTFVPWARDCSHAERVDDRQTRGLGLRRKWWANRWGCQASHIRHLHACRTVEQTRYWCCQKCIYLCMCTINIFDKLHTL